MTARVKQASLQRVLERAVRKSKELSIDTPGVSEDFVQTQMDHVASRFKEFSDIQDQIEAVCGNEELEREYGTREQAEEYYLAATSNFKTIKRQLAVTIENRQDDVRPAHAQQSFDTQLPRIKIPIFDGEYTNWPEFENLFVDIVHKHKQLTNSQKLHYLKANLTGDAASLLKSVSITNENYEEAWRILRDRYNHRRFIIDSHLRQFRTMPALQVESAVGLRKIIDTTTDTVRSLKVLGVTVTTWDIILINIIADKLDPETHRQWEITLTRSEYPSYEDLIKFLNARWQSLEMISMTRTESSTSQSIKEVPSSTHSPRTRAFRKPDTQSTRSLVVTSDSRIVPCQVCAGSHNVFQCDQFKPLTFERRSNLVREKRLCFNCLRKGHTSSDCKSTMCRVCNKRHHTLLHNSNPNPQSSSVESSSETPVTTNHVASPFTDVLLATAIAIVSHSNQNFIVRALLDSGSQVSFISESAANRIGLASRPATVKINGICAREASISRSITDLVLHSRIDPTFSTTITALIVEKITGILPSQPIDTHQWSHLNQLELADPHYYLPNKIDILLGADVIGMLQKDGCISGVNSSPFAQNTKFGYILFGKVERRTTNQPSSLVATIDDYNTIDKTLRSFWEIEDVRSIRELTHDESECERHYESTHYRNKDGRYTVFLPFNENSSPLGRSREDAVLRLQQMERRFAKNQQLHDKYNKFMQDYLESGHMEEVLAEDHNNSSEQTCYLPHHGVMQRKLRVVFDASHKTTTGISLNQKLRTGPKLQQNVFEILTRFRKHKFVFVSDIKQMYRQILMAPEHRNYQRIVWRPSPHEPVRDYRLCTVTYGTASAPYLAIRTIHQLARDEQEKCPIAANVASTDFYVDDLMTGSDNIANLIEIQRQMVQLLRCGGFELRKWSSNSQQLLNEIPIEFREHQGELELNWDDSVKTLGVHWSPSADCFGFNISPTSEFRAPTKRTILSQASRIFDRLGWVSPTTIIAKIILQELWVLGMSWDEAVPTSIAQRWLNYRDSLKSLESLRIDRWINHSPNRSNLQIHGFSDASEKAYAAVVYARITLPNGSAKITMLTSKTKVAPLKTVSLPRLELCASLLLAKLIHNIVQSLDVPQVQLYAWTDSQVVLGWLRSPPNRWKTFVANRVSRIMDYLQPTDWNYVDTKHNPADCASRGVEPSLLHSHPLWWTDPVWLREEPSQWPRQRTSEAYTNIDERKNSMIATHAEIVTSHNDLHNLLARHSSLGKLIRVTAFCRRFIHYCRQTPATRPKGFITVPELNWSFEFWVKLVQETHFADEISKCQSGEHLLDKSPLRSLNPFVGSDGILRVGGRLKESNLPYNRKHSIILPKDNQLTSLLISQAHRTTVHGGPQLMLAHIRKHYWILGIKTLVRSHIHKCVVCFRHRTTTSQQLIANLPSARVTPSRPFLHSGVDYAGPISIKLRKGRGGASTKGYICVFVCLSTKALHLELVSELTTNAFIASFKRFTARRGKIANLYSDCATNFVGANRQLAFIHQQSKREVTPEIAELLAQDGTTWNFIPPASPHFGGLWEAGVKSIKHHLRRIMGETLLTFEELTTLLCQIEACLNSRPLCPMSNDPDDYTILTPGHFLIGEAPLTIPEPTLLDVQTNRLNRYQQLQKMYQHFWRIWSTEYLSRLQQRPKWIRGNDNVVIGQLVLIKEENIPPSKWSLGRIIQTHPGSDGRVRVVTLKGQNGVYKRPVTKLCLLPILDNHHNNH